MNSGSWWWTGRPGVLLFMGSQRVGHDWATDLIWSDWQMVSSFPLSSMVSLTSGLSISLTFLKHWPWVSFIPIIVFLFCFMEFCPLLVLKYYLFLHGCAGSALCAGFLQLPWAGLLSTCGARASPHGGSSCCGAGVPGYTGSVALRPVGSSWTRDGTCVPCISRWVLNHWTTRESFIIYYAYFEASLLFFCVLKWKVRFVIRKHSFFKCEHLLVSPAF